MRVVDSVQELIDAISADQVLSREDVAVYIRSVSDISDEKIESIIARCDEACKSEMGYPLYNPAKTDSASAHIVDECVQLRRITASKNGDEKLAIITRFSRKSSSEIK